jgi:hypothetical protein
MKFLIIAKMKDSAFMLPPAVQRQMLEGTVAYMNQHKKEGKLQESYYVPGVGRTVLITGDMKSAEEFVKNQSGVPGGAFMDYEIVYPLADFNESLSIIMEAMKAAEKKMPGTSK